MMMIIIVIVSRAADAMIEIRVLAGLLRVRE